jgi:hypothetical protein
MSAKHSDIIVIFCQEFSYTMYNGGGGEAAASNVVIFIGRSGIAPETVGCHENEIPRVKTKKCSSTRITNLKEAFYRFQIDLISGAVRSFSGVPKIHF